MTGIFYFSSTGNSLYIAKKIKEEIDGKIIYIPDYNGNGSEFTDIIIVTPVYSFGLPVHTYDFLINLNNISKINIVLNYGGMCGGADYFIYSLAKENNKNIYGIYKFKMPENYTLTLSTPKFYNESLLKKSDSEIKKIIAEIKANNKTELKKSITLQNTHYKNKSNWHMIADDYSVTEDCIKCGKCIAICPADNISFENGKIIFSDKCVACLGCYHRCPQKAILYKNRKKKNRYINPYINETDIGKNFE